MQYKNVEIGRYVKMQDGSVAKVLRKDNTQGVGLVQLCFEVKNGIKTGIDGWWNPIYIKNHVRR